MLALLEDDFFVLGKAVPEDERVVLKPDLGLLVDDVANVLMQGQVEALEHVHDVGPLVLFFVAEVVKVLFEDGDK